MGRTDPSRFFVVSTKQKARGRPRGFDFERALAVAQALFHDKGYDAVGVAELTEAIGINPPSFYAASGARPRCSIACWTATRPRGWG